ncbi:unnamed protein product [Clonostachys rosea]|uniref:Uncharacterized protein n=1 Tax=Bionectria ochroleuca TaxID=29856 RepID=A0ABY6U354_BIOOC|nr:unnamed protein product [Clonostachys rosea]
MGISWAVLCAWIADDQASRAAESTGGVTDKGVNWTLMPAERQAGASRFQHPLSTGDISYTNPVYPVRPIASSHLTLQHLGTSNQLELFIRKQLFPTQRSLIRALRANINKAY